MKRARVAALWIATIVATWFIVRGQVDDRAPSVEERASVTAPRSAQVSAVPRPSLERSTPAPDDKELQAALATLERDMADGRWSLADRDRLTAATRRISGKQVYELYKVLFPKLNKGLVKTEFDGPAI